MNDYDVYLEGDIYEGLPGYEYDLSPEELDTLLTEETMYNPYPYPYDQLLESEYPEERILKKKI